MSLRSKGLILILSSPSGGGKSSLSKELLKADSNLRLSISVTTRTPRRSERDGVDYYFKTNDEFKKLIDQNLLLEHALIYDYYYGTPKDYVEDLLKKGIDVLFDIDWQGAKQIKEKMPSSTVSIFVLPPSLEILRERLYLRGEDSKEIIENRMTEAENEISHANAYDYAVVNNDFTTTLKQLKSILDAERCKVSRLDKLSNYL